MTQYSKIKKKFKRAKDCEFMPDDIFRMLMCGNSGCGKTNLLYHMLIKAMLHYDKIILYAKNLEQDKYQNLSEVMDELSGKAGYNIMEVSNDKIIPINDLGYEDNQKLVIFDDYVCEKNQNKIIDYFSQSFYKTPRDIRLNCSHYCIFEFPSSRERNMISSEQETRKKHAFLYVDKPKKEFKRKFHWRTINV